ncbi:DUF1835 domain-containing protein [Desulfobulbus rhabdoformis]|uniref:DUF1835 domain-containing protein n=1 Tax=Desulfobulbus rhabdoformis TaxID=34032 RepID=UPI001963EE5A|nr:DUF1835 domain-containing protein [Desulfobulbus rhabdoformis]MBM9616427.1 DUF1835 domain-containing protein [Desulfobulbus rhabdoformis]
METINLLHITSGDIAGSNLGKAGLAGEILVWHDILYDGHRNPGWPTEETLKARSRFLEETTAGGLHRDFVLETLRNQYRRLEGAASLSHIILWFDACLFDQAMLVHILSCLHEKAIENIELLCVDSYPEIVPYHGLGQLLPEQLASVYGQQKPVSQSQFDFAVRVDAAFSRQDVAKLAEVSAMTDAPIPWIPAAVARWLQEKPDPVSQLGLLERFALEAIRSGEETPRKIFAAVAAADTPPQYWGDITLWAKINGLADRQPPLVQIIGPAKRLPQWESTLPLDDFTIKVLE